MNSEYQTPPPSRPSYNDVSDDKIHSMSLIMMSHGHWGGLGDFIISRLQSYIPFLMKMLKMSTFGKLVLFFYMINFDI